jgi:hypothetical protein
MYLVIVNDNPRHRPHLCLYGLLCNHHPILHRRNHRPRLSYHSFHRVSCLHLACDDDHHHIHKKEQDHYYGFRVRNRIPLWPCGGDACDR